MIRSRIRSRRRKKKKVQLFKLLLLKMKKKLRNEEFVKDAEGKCFKKIYLGIIRYAQW